MTTKQKARVLDAMIANLHAGARIRGKRCRLALLPDGTPTLLGVVVELRNKKKVEPA
jgi:hypothetical protein